MLQLSIQGQMKKAKVDSQKYRRMHLALESLIYEQKLYGMTVLYSRYTVPAKDSLIRSSPIMEGGPRLQFGPLSHGKSYQVR
jgi:hypothetical protein